MTARKFTISVPAEVDEALRNAAEADASQCRHGSRGWRRKPLSGVRASPRE